MLRARTTLLFLTLVLVAAVVAGCGTRLPDDAFTASGSGTGADASGRRAGAGAPGADGTNDDGGSGGETATGPAPDAHSPTDSRSAAANGPGNASVLEDANGGGGGGGANTASDVGVTASEIKVGNITAVGGPLGPDIFSGMLHGAQAYFQALNERGGVNGRKIRFSTCDDRESSDRDNACAQNLVENQKVFALVANSTDTYASARYVDSKGVPDVGGQPIGNAYYKYPHLFSIIGADTPRDGKSIGDNGKLYRATNLYTYYKQKVGVSKAAVFFYFIPISRTAGLMMADGATRAGIDVTYYGGGSEAGMNPAAPTFDTDVIQMRNRGVDAIWNSIDIAGFQKLCQAMDRYAFTVKANVSTIQGMGDKLKDFSAPCRNSIWVDTESKSYTDTGDPAVAEFRSAMKKFDPGFRLHQWALEGWAAGKIFTDGVASMGAGPTRKGLVDWLNARPDPYAAVGLFRNISWKPIDHSKPGTNCYAMHQWQDSAGGWVTRTPLDCHPTDWFPYTPQDDGS
ncbi:MAG TPA: ABC transporter substrate-binding protein [Acidimicrobiales bacterium]|nr:ABC transporter substrate-binding protein [Acidimicrobiales bacterium]